MRGFAAAVLVLFGSTGCGWIVGVEDVGELSDGGAVDASIIDADTTDATTDAGPPDASRPDATVDTCGDGITGLTEGCDDHNTDGFDGCSATCAVERGWSCSGSPTSRCAPTGMVQVPAGWFVMGSDATDPDAETDEQPEHDVELSTYYIDRHEVTNAEYRACEDAGACSPPSNPDTPAHVGYHTDPTYDDYPVVYLSWSQMGEYCAWLGKRLPTEAEWEKAARGGCALVDPPTCGEEDEATYPWGEAAPTCDLVSYNGCSADALAGGSLSPAGDSPYGAQDLAGNVFEWVADFYSDTYYSTSPDTDPQGPASGPGRGMRGGSWQFGAARLRAADRGWDDPNAQSYDRGGRCADDADLRFVADDIYIYLSSGGGAVNASAGGDLDSAPMIPTSGMGGVWDNLAWSHDRRVMYVGTMGSADKVITLTPDGTKQDYATGIPGAAGVLVTREGRILVASYDDGKIFDVTGGGDFSGAAALVTGLYHPGAMVQLADGRVLVTSGSGGSSIYDINYPTGGAMTTGDQYATGLQNPVDVVQAPDGEIYVSLASRSLFKITGGGSFSGATPFATVSEESGLAFQGMAALRDGTLLVQGYKAGPVVNIYDVTAGGEITSATTPWATISVSTAVIDQVPYFEDGM